MIIEKNNPLPRSYRNFPYQYIKTSLFTILRKYSDEVFLLGIEETRFFQDCNRAKQKGRNLSDVINDYF